MKRQRPVTSCLQCRRRRVRCDRAHPICLRCTTSHLECKYDETGAESSSEKSGTAAGQTTPSALVSYVQDNDFEAPSSSVNESSKRRKSVEKGQLSKHNGGRSVYVGSTYWANAIPSDSECCGNLFIDTPEPEPNPFPKDPTKEDGTFDSAGQKFRPPRSWDLSWTRNFSKKCKLCAKDYNISCLLSLLPTREVCDKLCTLFFAQVFPLIPLLHLKAFSQDLYSFWNGINSEIRHGSDVGPVLRKNPSFLCLLSSILFAALMSTPKPRLKSVLGADAEINIGDIYFIAMVSATLTGFPRRPSIYSLAAYIYAQSQFVREEEFSDAPDFISTSFRIALGMGLHRYMPEAGFSVSESEVRCRLWWYILHLDVMSSCSSGLSPLFIDEKMASNDAICQYDQSENNYRQRKEEVDVRYLVASQRYAITKEIRNVLKCHFEDVLQNLEQVKRIENRLQKIAEETSLVTDLLLRSRDNSLSRQSRSTSLDTPRPSSSDATSHSFDRVWKLNLDADDREVLDFTAWATLLLHMMVHKAHCVLYHPLFRDPSMAAHESIRKNAVKHAQAFIQLFIRVCNDPISEPFHFMYPGTYQPLQAVSLLLADLLQHPHNDDASLSHGLIDAIFDLYQVDEGIVAKNDPSRRQLSPTGRDAWTMLVRTRRKALHQLDVDHHVLLPSSVVNSDYCICGERIAQSKPNDRVQSQQPSGEKPPSQRQTTPASRWEITDDHDIMSPGQILLGSADFDWRAWDNTLGPSGMLS